MKRRALTIVLAGALLAFGCTTQDGPGTKQVVGGLAGAAAGGLLGSQFGSGTGQLAATGAGVLIGALIGSEIGRTMDDVDKMKADEAVNKAHTAPLGETITWNNPDTGNSGRIKAVRDGTSSSGQYCREFQETITIGGKKEQGYGVACRQPDGQWRILDR